MLVSSIFHSYLPLPFGYPTSMTDSYLRAYFSLNILLFWDFSMFIVIMGYMRHPLHSSVSGPEPWAREILWIDTQLTHPQGLVMHSRGVRALTVALTMEGGEEKFKEEYGKASTRATVGLKEIGGPDCYLEPPIDKQAYMVGVVTHRGPLTGQTRPNKLRFRSVYRVALLHEELRVKRPG